MNARGFSESNQLGDNSNQHECYLTKKIVRAVYV
jgi:hypothetical protein